MKKKFVSLLLTACMVLGMLPVSAFAAGELTLTPAKDTLAAGEGTTITTATTEQDSVYWVSSDTKVLTISLPDGAEGGTIEGGVYTVGKDTHAVKVTATSTAPASDTGIQITAKQGSNDASCKAQGTCAVTVEGVTPITPTPVSSIKVSAAGDVTSVTVGKTLQLSADVQPTDAANREVTWSSSDKAIADVSETGLVTGVKAGKVTITATAKDGSKVTGKIELDVTDKTIAVETVTVDPAEVTMMEGTKKEVTVTVAPANATDKKVTAKSSKTSVANVAVDGDIVIIEGKAPGTATITVTAGEKSAEIKVTVKAFTIAPIKFTPTAGTYTEAQTVKVTSETSSLKITYTVTKEGNPEGKTETYDDAKGISLSENGTFTVKVHAVKEYNGHTYEADAEAKYTINTSVAVKEEAEVDEAETNKFVEENKDLTETQVEEVKAAASSVKTDLKNNGEMLQQVTESKEYADAVKEAEDLDLVTEDGNLKEGAAAQEAVAKLDNTKVDAKVKEAIAAAEPDQVKVVVQVVVKTAPKAYTPGKSITLDIAPYTRLVVTTDKNDIKVGENAAIVGTEKKVSVKKVSEPVKVEIELPAEIANGLVAWIKHSVSSSRVYWHRATRPSASGKFTFFNSLGFSDFGVGSTPEDIDAPAVQISSTEEGRTSLAAALNDAENGETIYILTKDTKLLTYSWKKTGTKTFTLKPDGQYVKTISEDMFKITGKKDDSVTVEKDGDALKYTITNKSSSSSGSSSGVGGGGGIVMPSTGSDVSVSSATGGKVSLSTNNAVKGDKVTLTVKPDAGYVLSSVVVKDSTGKEITLTKVNDNEFTFIMPAGAVTVTPVFVKSAVVNFYDVPTNAYYYNAVQWAIEKGITNGTGANTFGPEESCTRAQMVTFLWRAAGSPEPTSTVNTFKDVSSSQYYYKAVLWAAEKGITTGTAAGTFSPDATVTRGQTVTFMYRAAGSPASGAASAFSDVSSSEYYAPAVQWALKNGVTNGTSANTFSPSDNCIRAQIVTFLYRASN